MIGLSGLITPSLEEMTHVAREMQRQDFHLPLLIGGATTSRAHTALKIEPHYKSPTVWVKDASRAVGVAQSLISTDMVDAFMDEDPRRLRRDPRTPQGSRRRQAPGPAREGARAALRRRLGRPPAAAAAASPGSPCSTTSRWPNWLPFIDWSPFFNAWELAGRFPAILDDAVVGAQASELYRDAQAMLERIVDEKWLRARGVFGLWPANADRRRRAGPWRCDGSRTWRPCTSCASRSTSRSSARISAWPTSSRRRTSGVDDWIGAFAVTAGIGIDAHVARFEAANTTTIRRSCSRRWPTASPKPSPNACTSACARITGAMRQDEALDNDALIAEKLPAASAPPRATRPAPTTPKRRPCSRCSMRRPTPAFRLTESFAMLPTAAVSGWYFSHPKSQYFVVGRVSPRTGRGLCAGARAGRLPRPSAGWRRTSTTIRSSGTSLRMGNAPAGSGRRVWIYMPDEPAPLMADMKAMPPNMKNRTMATRAEDQVRLAEVGLVRIGSARESPDEQHDDIDQRNCKNNEGDDPVAERHDRCTAAIFHACLSPRIIVRRAPDRADSGMKPGAGASIQVS